MTKMSVITKTAAKRNDAPQQQEGTISPSPMAHSSNPTAAINWGNQKTLVCGQNTC